MELIRELRSGAEDINIDRMKRLIESYNGFYFFFRLYRGSDEFYVLAALIYAWIGIFTSSENFMQKESGFGNMIVSRVGYNKYEGFVLRAQSLYIATVLGMVLVLQICFALLAGGMGSLDYLSGEHSFNVPVIIFIVLSLYMTLVFYFVTSNIIANSLIHVIRNKYLMQGFPILIFAALPLILGSTIGNVLSVSQFIVNIVNPFWYLTCILTDLLNTFRADDLMAFVISISIFFITAFLLDRRSRKKMSVNYL
jgi:hypothetical protein